MGTLVTVVWTNEIAGRTRNDESKARNDVPSHPGPDSGSSSSVCANEHARHCGPFAVIAEMLTTLT